MSTYQQRLAVYTKLLSELNELELLRERVKKAELLTLHPLRPMAKQKKACSRRKPRDVSRSNHYRSGGSRCL
jgi:hypothetical protein